MRAPEPELRIVVALGLIGEKTTNYSWETNRLMINTL